MTSGKEFILPNTAGAATRGDDLGIPGKNQSGKPWKVKKARTSSLVTTKGFRPSYKVQQERQAKVDRTKALERALLGEIQAEKDEKKRRQKEARERRAENQKKEELRNSVVVKDPRKIKKLSKKMLKFVRKI
jgi:hypothetical protein